MTVERGNATSEAGLAEIMTQIQKVPDNGRTSLVDHLKRLALAILDGGEGPVDVALLSKTLKRQILEHTGNDSFLPVVAQHDVTQLKQALSVFGCAVLCLHMRLGPGCAFSC